MKNLCTLLVAIVGFSFLNAQTSNSNETTTTIPTSIKMAFKDNFKSTTAEWSATSQYYIANWDVSGKHKVAYYAKDASTVTLVRTENIVPLTDLSLSTQSMVNEKFLNNGSNYTLNRSFKVENSNEVVEGVEFNMGNGTGNKISVFFDAQGSMVKREIAQ